jgi:hypothetical protein
MNSKRYYWNLVQGERDFTWKHVAFVALVEDRFLKAPLTFMKRVLSHCVSTWRRMESVYGVVKARKKETEWRQTSHPFLTTSPLDSFEHDAYLFSLLYYA